MEAFVMRRMGAWAVLLGILGASPVWASDGLSKKVDEVFAEWDKTDSPGCSVGVYRDGEIEYARGYGMANLDYGIALSSKSVFRIGSTSKQFTAMCIALLAEEGKLSPDDDIRKYIPEFPDYPTPVTIRHLVHHTSGLRDYLTLQHLADRGENYNNEDVVRLLSRQKVLNFPAGEEHLYSNSGYFLMAVLVRRITGESIREYAEEKIFGPLGMKNTHFHDDHTEIVANRAYGYERDGKSGFRVSMTTLDMVGDGGVFTSAEDLLFWDNNFYDNKLGQGLPSLLKTVQTPGQLNSGEALEYAWGLTVGDYRGLKTVSHGGAFVGFRAELMRIPEHRFSVAVLCNLGATNPTSLAREVVDIYLSDHLEGEKVEVPEKKDSGAVTTGESRPHDVTGYYLLWNGMVASIQRDGERLVFKLQGEEGKELVPRPNDRFYLETWDVEAWFKGEQIFMDSSGRELTGKKLEGEPLRADELSDYPGRYYSEELDVDYRITLKDGLRVARGAGSDELELLMFEKDQLLGPFFKGEFRRNEEGRISGFVIDAGRVRGISFSRRLFD
jgi:CubicO group peptidase (beta-lactamase class C family)